MYRRFTGSRPGLPSVSPPSYRTVRSLWMSLLGLSADGAAFKDLTVGHQVAQTLDGLRPDVDMEVLDVLDHHLRGCGSWVRRQFRHDGRHLRLDAGLGGPVPDGLIAGQIDQLVDPTGNPNSVMTLRLAVSTRIVS